MRVELTAEVDDGEPERDADCDSDTDWVGDRVRELLGDPETEAAVVCDVDGDVDGDVDTCEVTEGDAVADADEEELPDGVSDTDAEAVELALAVADAEGDDEPVADAVALEELDGDGDAVAEEDGVAVPVADVVAVEDGEEERVTEAEREVEVEGDTDTDGDVLPVGVAVGVTHDTISAIICAPDSWFAALVVKVTSAVCCVMLTARMLAATLPSVPEPCHTSGMAELAPSYTLSTSCDASVFIMMSRRRICQPGGNSPRCSSSEQVTAGGYCDRRLVMTSTGAPIATTAELVLLSSAEVEHIGAIEGGSGGTASAISCTPDSWPPPFDVKRRNADGPVVFTWRPYSGYTS